MVNLEPKYRRCKFLDLFNHELPSHFNFGQLQLHIVLVNNLNYNNEKLPRVKIDRANKSYMRRCRGRPVSIWTPGNKTRVFKIINRAKEVVYLYLFRAATQRGCLVEAGLFPPMCMIAKKSDSLEVGLLADRSLEEL